MSIDKDFCYIFVCLFCSLLDTVASKRHAEKNKVKIKFYNIIHKLGAWKSSRNFINRQEVDLNVKGQCLAAKNKELSKAEHST